MACVKNSEGFTLKLLPKILFVLLSFNKFIKDCLSDNATKENCKKAKDTLIMILGNGEYAIYEDIPLEKIKNANTLAILYDICKNINLSIVGGIQ